MTRRVAVHTRSKRRSGSPVAYVVCGLALATGVLLRAGLPQPANRTPDELAYTVYSAILSRSGLGTEPTLVTRYTTEQILGEVPPPTRVGFLWLGSAFMSITGSSLVTTLVSISTLCSILQLFVVAAIALGAFDGWVAAIAVLFLACSPLDLAIARRAWVDDVLGLVASLMLWAFVRAAAQPERRVWPALVFALGTYATLVKETGVLLVLLGALGLAIVAWRNVAASAPPGHARVSLRPLVMLLGGAASVAIAAATLSLACGGFAPWWKALEHTSRAVASNDYVRQYQTGSALYYAQGVWILQPLPWLLGALGTLLVVVRAPFMRVRWTEPGSSRALQAVAWYTAALLLVACLYPQKNLRFLSPIYGSIAILAALTLRAARDWARAHLPARARNALRVATALTAVLIVLSVSADVRRFADLFLGRQIPDLATPWFTGHALPPP